MPKIREMIGRRWGWIVIVALLSALLSVTVAFASGKTERRSDRTACPKDVVVSSRQTVGSVLVAAQRLLAQQTVDVQGRSYRLTPKWAPINLVEYIATSEGPGSAASPLDEQIPGLLTLHRLAERECGWRTAQATWAIHYSFPTIIAALSAHVFFTQTRHGWVFWGDWCGGSHSRAWYRAHCV